MLVYRPDGTLEKAVTLPSEGGNAFYPLKDGWLNYVGFAGNLFVAVTTAISLIKGGARQA
jgi:hypothetical protein